MTRPWLFEQIGLFGGTSYMLSQCSRSTYVNIATIADRPLDSDTPRTGNPTRVTHWVTTINYTNIPHATLDQRLEDGSHSRAKVI